MDDYKETRFVQPDDDQGLVQTIKIRISPADYVIFARAAAQLNLASKQGPGISAYLRLAGKRFAQSHMNSAFSVEDRERLSAIAVQMKAAGGLLNQLITRLHVINQSNDGKESKIIVTAEEVAIQLAEIKKLTEYLKNLLPVARGGVTRGHK